MHPRCAASLAPRPAPVVPLNHPTRGAASWMVVGFFSSLLPWLTTACSDQNLGNEWFPLRQGESLNYAVEYLGEEPRSPEHWTLHAIGSQTFQEQQVFVRHHSAGVSYYLLSSDKGIQRVATRTDIDNEPTADAEPVWVLKAPYEVGTEWTTLTVPYLIQRRNEHPRDLKYTHRAQMTWRIEAVDDAVKLKDGSTHQPCLRVVGEARLNLYTDPVNGFTDVPLISREWYCRGRGLLRLEREEKVPSGFLTGGSLNAEWLR